MFDRISVKISRFLSRFQDFGQDFKISGEILRFQARFQRFQDFRQDFQKISRFKQRFQDFYKISKRFQRFRLRVYEISRSCRPLGCSHVVPDFGYVTTKRSSGCSLNFSRSSSKLCLSMEGGNGTPSIMFVL